MTKKRVVDGLDLTRESPEEPAESPIQPLDDPDNTTVDVSESLIDDGHYPNQLT